MNDMIMRIIDIKIVIQYNSMIYSNGSIESQCDKIIEW